MSWQDVRAMSPAQYKRAIARLGMSQNASGRFFDLSESTIRRICRGDAEVPVAVCMLLALMQEHGEWPNAPKRKQKTPKLDAHPQ